MLISLKGGASVGKSKVKPKKNSRGGLSGPDAGNDNARAPSLDGNGGNDRGGGLNRAPPVRAPPIKMG